jgi:hypothetical protein
MRAKKGFWNVVGLIKSGKIRISKIQWDGHYSFPKYDISQLCTLEHSTTMYYSRT